jgi:hypothetical protein
MVAFYRLFRSSRRSKVMFIAALCLPGVFSAHAQNSTPDHRDSTDGHSEAPPIAPKASGDPKTGVLDPPDVDPGMAQRTPNIDPGIAEPPAATQPRPNPAPTKDAPDVHPR